MAFQPQNYAKKGFFCKQPIHLSFTFADIRISSNLLHWITIGCGGGILGMATLYFGLDVMADDQ